MITSCCVQNGYNIAFGRRLVPAKVSRLYENFGFKKVLFPFMDFKARNYPQVVKESLVPVLEKVQIPLEDGSHIYGWEANPENAKKYVLFLHGIKGKSPVPPNQTLIEKILNKGGYGVITPEYRGSAELSHERFSFQNVFEDSKATLSHLYKKGIKPEDITIVSHCIGSIPAARLVADEKGIGQVILVSPLVDGNGVGTSISKALKLNLPKSIEDKLNSFLEIFMPYEINTARHIHNAESPITVILPENDGLVSKEQCSELVKRIKNLKEFITVPNGVHSLNERNCNVIVDNL